MTSAQTLQCERLCRQARVDAGEKRRSRATMLLGDPAVPAVHVDNGVSYTFDVTRCMFSPGNITEKLRLARLDCSNEVVVDMFAGTSICSIIDHFDWHVPGIGYFTLPYLVHARAKFLHACEWNDDAIVALQRNLVVNGVQGRCQVYHGDNRLVCRACVMRCRLMSG